MNPVIQDVIRNSESRYLNEEEKRQVLAFTNSLAQRFKISSLVEQKEDAVVKAVIDQMKRMYPNFDRYHPQAWERAYRDIQLVLRYTVQAMVWNDLMMHEEKVLIWLGTILASFGFTPKFVRDTYILLKEEVSKNIPADGYALLEPFLQKTIEVMGSIPEPAVALV